PCSIGAAPVPSITRTLSSTSARPWVWVGPPGVDRPRRNSRADDRSASLLGSGSGGKLSGNGRPLREGTSVARPGDRRGAIADAVCDLWKNNRERAAANAGRDYGRAPHAVQHPEELLALKDVDAVLIATPEHSHSLLLKAAVEAGKHAYCEKPMGNVLEEVKAARDAVKERNLVVQVGTQHRSEPYQLAAREVLRSGGLGDVSKYEIVWNYNGPRWRGRPEVKLIRPEDTDWKTWLMTKKGRPFDPQLYFEFRLYREFSSGIH